MGYAVPTHEWWMAWLIPLFYAGALAWIIAVIVMALKGNDMEHSDRVAQLYGYTVCLIAVVVALISVSSLVDSAFKLASPLQAGGYPYATGATLSSFDAYKATVDRDTVTTVTTANRSLTRPGGKKMSDGDIRRSYEALRADRIASAQYEGARSVVSALIMLAIAVLLFAFHWRWLRGRGSVAAA